MRSSRVSFMCAFAIALLALAGTIRADTITLRGTTIAVPVTVERIASGRVFYADHTGRSLYRLLDDIEHITFAELPQLSEAARAIDDDRYRDAAAHLMRALIAAETDAQRIWTHAMLARAHDILGEYVQACGHFAAVVLLEDHVYWRNLAPVSETNEPTFAAAEEAMVLLRRARQQVSQSQLAPLIAQMIQRIEPIHRRLAAAYDGPAIEPGATVSGIALEVILDAQAKPQAEDEPQVPDAPPASEPARDAPRQPGAEPARGESVERLIETGQWEEALAALEQSTRQPGRRDAAQLLYNHGRALAGASRPRDAAIKFTRCAILHPGSPYASLSLIETSIIYRDTFNRHDTAARLLERANEEEKAHNRADVVDRINQVRQTLTP